MNLPIRKDEPTPPVIIEPQLNLSSLLPTGAVPISQQWRAVGESILGGLVPMLEFFESRNPPPIPCPTGCGYNLRGLNQAQIRAHMSTHGLLDRLLAKLRTA